MPYSLDSKLPKKRNKMKKFVFPLRRAADWYRQTLSVEEAALQRMVGEIRNLERMAESLAEREREERRQVQDRELVLGRDLESLAAYVGLIREELARLQPARARLQSRMVEQRQRVLACHRRVRLIEELQQRRRGEWARESQKEEEAVASELYLAMFQSRENQAPPEGEAR
jgi:hypothetical protein